MTDCCPVYGPLLEGIDVSMTSVWMGHRTLKAEVEVDKIELAGDRAIASSMSAWLGLSPLAKEYRRRVA